MIHLGFPSPSIADLDTRHNGALARLCEELGFDTLWHSNERFFREMFVRMTSSTMATSEIGIGGAVVEPFAVHPALTAQSLATVDELSGGRATLAIGAGGSGFSMMGVKRRRSARAVREAHHIMKGLLAGEEVTYDGELIQATGARLEFVPERAPTLWVATRGDVTLKTSGEYADAVMIATYANEESVGTALALVEGGARRVGRSLDDLRIMVRVDACVHPDEEAAYRGTRLMLARVLWTSYPDRNFVQRAGLAVPDEIEALIATRDSAQLPQIAERLPDAFVSAFAWAGTPEMVRERVMAVARATGVTEFGFWLLPTADQTREEAATLLATAVVPSIRAALTGDPERR